MIKHTLLDKDIIAEFKSCTDEQLIATARCLAKVYHPEDHPHDHFTVLINKELHARKLDNICQECLLVCRYKDSFHFPRT
jgi:hypothetical protein